MPLLKSFLFLTIIIVLSSCTKKDTFDCPFKPYSNKVSIEKKKEEINNTLLVNLQLPVFKKIKLELRDSLGVFLNNEQFIKDSIFYSNDFIKNHNNKIDAICGCLQQAQSGDSLTEVCENYIKLYMEFVFSNTKKKSIPKKKPKTDFISNKKFKNSKEHQELAILILNQDNSINSYITQLIAEECQKLGYRTSINLFNKHFVQKRKFHELLNQRSGLDFSKPYTDAILLGKVNTNMNESQETIKNWKTFTSKLNITLTNTNNGDSQFISSISNESHPDSTQALYRTYDSLITANLKEKLIIL